MLTYHINLDERGGFRADVRRDGQTIFEFAAGNELGEDETSIFEDGFMSGKYDLTGLAEYLVELDLLEDGETIFFEGRRR